MKAFAAKEKRSAPATVRRRPYVHAPFGAVQRAQQARIGRILRSTSAQAKLIIGQPGDRYEQEADRVADQVMAMPDPGLQRQPENEEEEALRTKPLADQITPLVQRQEEPPEEEEEPVQAKFWYGETVQRQSAEEEDEELQTKEQPGRTPQVTPNIESRINGLKSRGQPLDRATRSFFEPRFGRDFSDVRLHTDSAAADTAKSINARAFTLGNHVAMCSGEYQPTSQSGQRLLGHELTHVIQQSDFPLSRMALPVSLRLRNIQRKTNPATETVSGTLWAKDARGKTLPPSLEDISQGGVADCYLFAAMAAIVNTDPQKIVDMIKDNGDGTYTVTFAGIGWLSSAKQTVSAKFVVGKHGNVTARKALWPLIIEKAYAQQKGGISAIGKGGNAGDAVEDMLNDGPSRFDPRKKSISYIMGKLTKAKQKKWPMTILSPKKDDASKKKKAMADSVSGLYFWHTYAIIDVDPAKNRIKLFNPWGHSHPNGDGWIKVEQVRKFFIEIDIND